MKSAKHFKMLGFPLFDYIKKLLGHGQSLGNTKGSVSNLFDISYQIDVQKLCLYVGTTLQSLSSHLLQVLSQQVNLVFQHLSHSQLVIVQVLVDIFSDKLQEAMC